MNARASSFGAYATAGLASFVTYLCVSGSASGAEVALGLGVATLATLALAAAVQLADIRQQIRISWLGRLARPSLQVVTDILPLTRALLSSLSERRPLQADASERPFDPGASDEALAAGRRALVTIGLSISPASLICERDLDCHELVVATIGLEPLPTPSDPCWPL